jgi:glycosyltransferase involved in cell wall biosynthesis
MAAEKGKSLRIGMLLDMYKPYVSGVTNYVSLHKRALEALGHKVFIFTFGGGAYDDEELYVIRSPGLPFNVQATGLQVSYRYSRQAQLKLRTMDVLHAHHPFVSGPLALRYGEPRGIPVAFTNHTRYDLYAQHYLPSFIPDGFAQTLLQTYLPGFCDRCDLVVAPSPGIAQVMKDLGVTREITVIPNGVDLSPFQNPPPGRARADIGLPPESVVLMYLGRLGPEKNITFLMRAFTGVAAACPDAVLALVGDGPEADNLRDQAEKAGVAERVKFYGAVDYSLVPEYLKLADVFVTASQSEGHPLSLIEAMASGLPAVGIESPGVGDTIVDGVNGFLSTPDLAIFTAKLVRLVMDVDLRHRLSEGARESALLYDINRTVALLLDEYVRLVANGARRRHGLGGALQRLRKRLA